MSTQTPTPIPSADPQHLAVDGFAEVVTTDLVVRSAPGTGQDSAILGKVENLPVIVLDGPVRADGYEWWLITPNDGAVFEPAPSGWVAAGGEGEVWLAPTSLICEDSPTSDALWQMPPAIWVGCYGDGQVTVRGAIWRCSELADGMGWYNSGCALRSCSPEMCEQTYDDRSITVHLDPLPPKDEGRIRVTGHFDDPRAEGCGADGDPLSRLRVFWCRTHFVATSYQFVD